jgi:hypothetical protein
MPHLQYRKMYLCKVYLFHNFYVTLSNSDLHRREANERIGSEIDKWKKEVIYLGQGKS